MWKNQKVTVVLMTYAERDSIRNVIEGFAETGLADEVLVVNNNAEEGTAEEVAKTDARQVFESKQGYGNAIRRGLVEATGDLIVLAEPDGTFLPSDLVKLLAYSDECDVVFGTRTTRELIWHGSNMGSFLKWGNWMVAKLVEVLFNTSHLSDVGCTYRLIRRPLADYLVENMKVGGSHAGPEIMLLSITSGARFVEIPVNYLPRVGKSSVTGNQLVAFALGLRMVGLILQFRLKTPRRPPRPSAFDGVAEAPTGYAEASARED
jgi:glycosyltransferase involved in cell wall biosynthesis